MEKKRSGVKTKKGSKSKSRAMAIDRNSIADFDDSDEPNYDEVQPKKRKTAGTKTKSTAKGKPKRQKGSKKRAAGPREEEYDEEMYPPYPHRYPYPYPYQYPSQPPPPPPTQPPQYPSQPPLPPPHYPSQPPPYPYYPPPNASSKPSIAGVLLVITAILGFLMGIALGFGGIMFADVDNDMETMGLDENVDIEGIVRSNTGTPLQYVKVSIVDKQLFTTTDARGKFILLDVPPGKQEIMVEKEGYTTIIHKAFITPSGSWLEQFRDYDPDAYEKEFEFELTPGEGTKRTGSFPQFALFSCILFACAMVAVVFSIVALIGAYFAFKRRKFAITMIGAILGIFSLGFFIGAILSIVALFLLILSRDEFKRRKQMDMQRMDMHRKDEKINR